MFQGQLFSSTVTTLIDEDSCRVDYHPAYLSQDFADQLFCELLQMEGWRQDHIFVYGKRSPLPRLHRWFSTDNSEYRWSGIVMHPEPFPVITKSLLNMLGDETQAELNTALANLYRNNKDSVSWHSDDEPEMGQEPIIASISLGETRRFVFRCKSNRLHKVYVDLEHGSLLLMRGKTQSLWEHSVPRTQRARKERINITFRAIQRRRIEGF
jgi:alkylated DNA repair dioxygenase AlkB